MIGYPEAPKAWWLTRGMARISGVNLPRAVVEGWLQRTELEDLVARCAACGRASRRRRVFRPSRSACMARPRGAAAWRWHKAENFVSR